MPVPYQSHDKTQTKKNYTSLVFCSLLAISPTLTWAEQENHVEQEGLVDQEILNELSLEKLYALPLVAIATGTAVPLEQAPSVATLITAKDIQAMGALTLDEVLESVPGLHVSPSTIYSSNAFSIRGMHRRHK